MTDPRESSLTDWEEPLARALDRCGAADPPVLFAEERLDLRVELLPDRPPSSVPSLWRGLAARGSAGRGPVAFQADPSPDDASRLVRLASNPAPRYPRVEERKEREVQLRGSLPERELIEAISGLIDLLGRLQPRAEIVGRGVAFEQRVVVARTGRPPVRDTRRSARLRLECRLPRAATAAVAELVFPRHGAEVAESLRPFAERLAQRASALEDAREAPHGQLPVVLAPGVGGVLVHEIVGHALEADRVLTGDSWLGLLEDLIAPRELAIVDDPRRGRAAWRIDDEGEPSLPTALIRDGRVAGWLHDSRTAQAAKKPPTGHGRCSSYREPIQPRMGCTFVAPGKHEPAELLQGVREGVYVRRMEAGTTDTRSGRAVFRVTDSDRIQNGRIDAPLRPHLLFVNGARVLAAADRIANDLVFDSCIGSCHRKGQPLSISVGAPTMWIGVAEISARENWTRAMH